MNETWYFLVVDGVVVQKQPYWEEGFIEGPDDVIVGYFYANGVFTPPPVPEPDWLALNTAELERLQRLANAQVTALQGRFNTLNWLINIQTPEDQEEAGEEYIEPTTADIAELAAVKTKLTKWNSYNTKLGKVKAQTTWPSAPVWPLQPEPYTSETSAVTAPAL